MILLNYLFLLEFPIADTDGVRYAGNSIDALLLLLPLEDGHRAERADSSFRRPVRTVLIIVHLVQLLQAAQLSPRSTSGRIFRAAELLHPVR